MAPHQATAKQEKRKCPMQARETVDHRFTSGIAEMMTRQSRNQEVAHEDREDHRPHQRVPVIAAGHAGRHDVSGAEPGEHRDSAWTKGTAVTPESGRHLRAGDRSDYSACWSRSRIRQRGAHEGVSSHSSWMFRRDLLAPEASNNSRKAC